MKTSSPEQKDVRFKSLAGVLDQPRSRRLLLGATARGMAMAASGLFLPNWLLESAARDGALEGDRGGRRGKNHRGRRRRRSHGDNKGKPRSGGPIKARPIMFLVDMYGAHAPIKADFYSTRLRPGVGDAWELKASKTVAPSVGGVFSTPDIKAAVWLDDRILISADARVTGVRIGHGGDFWAGNRGWQGGQTVFDDSLEVQELTIAYAMEGYRIRVERLSDENDTARYHVLINPAF